MANFVEVAAEIRARTHENVFNMGKYEYKGTSKMSYLPIEDTSC